LHVGVIQPEGIRLEPSDRHGAVRGAYSPATERAYRADWTSFESWCQRQGLTTLPALPATVAAYLRAESDAGRAVATVRRRVATIALVHRAAGLANQSGEDVVRLVLKAIARERGTQQKQAAPLNSRDADKIVRMSIAQKRGSRTSATLP
jgi:site-specific recombinase XerD